MGLLLVGAGCSVDRLVASFSLGAFADAGSGLADEHWADFVAQLPTNWLPSCPDGGLLWVDTLEDQFEGGPDLRDPAQAGVTLSLREAVHLAANTSGPHAINFDEHVFPLAQPGVIRITDDALTFPSMGLQQTCISAVGRGVIIEWALPAGRAACDGQCIWRLGAGSSMTGLVIRGNAQRLLMTDSVIAANRFAVDEIAVSQGRGSVIGPKNAFVGGTLGVETDLTPAGHLMRVHENYFGVEPEGLLRTPLRDSMVLSSSSSFLQGNVFAVSPRFETAEYGGVIQNSVFAYFDSSGARHNVELVTRPGWSFIGNVLGDVVNVRPSGIGPGSRFFDNWFAGDFVSDGPVAQILDAGSGRLSGRCPATGTVEVHLWHEVSQAAADDLQAVRWAPVKPAGLGIYGCEADAGWVSLGSSTFKPGDRVATTFTEEATRHTGPFSSVFVVPSGP